jgi:hypothetical protein
MLTLAVGMFAVILGIHMPTASVGMAPKTHQSTTDRALEDSQVIPTGRSHAEHGNENFAVPPKTSPCGLCGKSL